jgi:hypothetical protein
MDKLNMKKQIKIVVSLGCVTDVYSNFTDVDVELIDMDDDNEDRLKEKEILVDKLNRSKIFEIVY